MPRTAHTLCRRGYSRLKATKSLKRVLLTSFFHPSPTPLSAGVNVYTDAAVWTTLLRLHPGGLRVVGVVVLSVLSVAILQPFSVTSLPTPRPRARDELWSVRNNHHSSAVQC